MGLKLGKNEKTPPPILGDILLAREHRALRQRALLDRYGRTLISFTPLAPGAEKTSSRFRRIHRAGRNAILEVMKKADIRILRENSGKNPGGFESLFVLAIEAGEIKRLMMEIEEKHPLGRLFDIDVLGSEGYSLSRVDFGFPRRRCLLCERPAAECARSGAHPLEQLLARIDQLLGLAETQGGKIAQSSSPDENLVARVGRMAYGAMMEEVSVTPKPGLVDRAGSGAHRDMDFFTFQRSAKALKPWFEDFVREGEALAHWEPEDIFHRARPLGQEAERAMFSATGGVNTHKGLVFSLGLLCLAAGVLDARGSRPLSARALCDFSALMCAGIVERELRSRGKQEGKGSHGERVFSLYGVSGVRGEAEGGFPTVLQISLPRLRSLGAQYPKERNHVLLEVLLSLMSRLEDTNILTRGGPAALEHVHRSARQALALGGPFTVRGMFYIEEMNRDFAASGISPGGSADLLAVSIFLDRLEKGRPVDPL